MSHICFTSSVVFHIFFFIQQQPPQGSFIPPARRPRKPQRRAGPGNAANEIGAGDAPLPTSQDDLSAHVETLKI